MDRELARKVVALIHATDIILEVQDEMVLMPYHLRFFDELRDAYHELRNELNSGIHDAYINN